MSENIVTLGKFPITLSIILAVLTVIGANETTSAQTNETKVQAGTGVGTVSMTLFSPNQVEIASGESVTWYNPTAVAEPHTVSFILDNKAKADLVAPFAIPNNSAKLEPIIPNSNNEPLLTPDNSSILAVNKRVFNSVVIDSTEKVIPLPQNTNYTLTGTERYVNSGWLLPKGLEQTYPGSANTFTVTFQKSGNYDYLCLVHPYMTGRVTVN